MQIGNLLIGPEGSYIDAFISKAGQPYQSLIEASKEYPQAKVSKLIRELDGGQDNDLNKVSGLITNYNTFGLKSTAKAVLGIGSVNETVDTKDVIYVSLEGNADVEFKINKAINDIILDLKNSMETESLITIRNMIMFGNQNYMNMIISASATDKSGKFSYEDKNLTFDMQSGELVKITDLLDMPWKKLQGELESLTGKSINEIPDFYIGRIGIDLSIPREGSEFNDYAVVTYDDIVKFIPMDRFYK